MTTIKAIKKQNQLVSQVLELCNDQMRNDTMTLPQSDLQSCLEAIIMDAINYGRGTK